MAKQNPPRFQGPIPPRPGQTVADEIAAEMQQMSADELRGAKKLQIDAMSLAFARRHYVALRAGDPVLLRSLVRSGNVIDRLVGHGRSAAVAYAKLRRAGVRADEALKHPDVQRYVSLPTDDMPAGLQGGELKEYQKELVDWEASKGDLFAPRLPEAADNETPGQ